MANTMTRPPNVGFVNSLKAVADQGGSGSNLSNASNYVSITALRSRLQAINAAYYTNTLLDQMTVNDMVYAVRLADDKTTVSNYQP
ncbi:hypothetical protein [Streptomyces griseosporeus]|uniref:hypothetical protein n=1 Tax=Streptomyces griseosporeus TaxID=1910 RepID=UPI00167EFA40|nr:hypothetical protein [Streptomyces griseosporeus]GHF92076.1 hypothetical protein GCM10018783_73630 [Streptomyces griseosporeus]